MRTVVFCWAHISVEVNRDIILHNFFVRDSLVLSFVRMPREAMFTHGDGHGHYTCSLVFTSDANTGASISANSNTNVRNRMSTNENKIRHKHNTSKIMRTFLVLELTLVLMPPPSRPISNVCACPCVASENQAETTVKKYKVQFKLKNRVKT